MKGQSTRSAAHRRDEPRSSAMSHHRGLECEPSEDIFWRLIVAASVSSCFIGIFYLTNSKSGSFGGVFHGTLDCRNSRKSFQKVLVIVMPGPNAGTGVGHHLDWCNWYFWPACVHFGEHLVTIKKSFCIGESYEFEPLQIRYRS